MKKFLLVILAVLMCLSVFACKEEKETSSEAESKETSQEESSQVIVDESEEAESKNEISEEASEEASEDESSDASENEEVSEDVCEHEWTDATCKAPKTCKLCGEQTGNIGTHNYVNDNCSVCGKEVVWTYKNGGDDFIIKTDGTREIRIPVDMSHVEIPEDDPDGYYVIKKDIKRNNIRCINGWIYFNEFIEYHNEYIKDTENGNYAGIMGGLKAVVYMKEDGSQLQCIEDKVDYIAGYAENVIYFFDRNMMNPDYGKLGKTDLSNGPEGVASNIKMLSNVLELVPTSSYIKDGVIYCEYSEEDPFTGEPVGNWQIEISDYDK